MNELSVIIVIANTVTLFLGGAITVYFEYRRTLTPALQLAVGLGLFHQMTAASPVHGIVITERLQPKNW